MKRYTFLLLAFFLSMNAHGLSVSSGSGISAAPNNSVSVVAAPEIQKNNSRTPNATSSHAASELGNISESTEKAQQPAPITQLNKKKTSSLSTISCKTYQGKVYDQGEAGYNDCIRTIKNDRQGSKTIP